MESFVSVAFLILTTILYMVVAALASKGVKTKESYLLGDRTFSVFSITLTLIATQLGAGMIFGTAQEAYHRGLSGIAYVMGMAIGLIILGLGVGARLRSLEISTTAELFETKYGSKGLRKIAAIISIMTMGGILAAQIVASRQLFSTLFDLSPVWLMLFWLAIIGYTTFGGLRAVIATDILQVVFIVVVFTGVLFYIIPLNEFSSTMSINIGENSSLVSEGFFATLIAPVLFSMIEQDLAQRFFAARTKKVATISALLAALFLILYAFVPILLGMHAKASGITFLPGQSPLVLMFQTNLSSFGMTVIACALLAAICSTADSLLGAAGTNLIADFLPADGKFSLATSRLLTLAVGVVALIIAFNFDDVIRIIVKSYEISICALFVPMILAMYQKAPSRLGAQLSVGVGIATYAAFTVMQADFSPTIGALVCSALSFMLGTQLDKKTAA